MEAEWEGCGMNDSGYQRHPLSAAFPDMSGADVDALAGDIEKHGQAAPGVILDGMILDGWHRYLACIRADVSFTAFDYDGDDPVAFVFSKNLHRRHLTSAQRAACVVAAMEWRPSSAKSGRVAAAATLKTNGEMAKLAEVSERTIVHAKRAHEAGIGNAVRDGKVSAERAATIAKLPKAKRERALEKKPKPAKAAPDTEKLKSRIAELEADIADLKEKNEALGDIASSINAFQNMDEFKAMQQLRARLKSTEKTRDEFMAECSSQKRFIAILKKKLAACGDKK